MYKLLDNLEASCAAIKVDNLDLFTQQANSHYRKHIKTQSKRALEVIDALINWEALLEPIEAVISRSDRGRKPFSLVVIVKCFILQAIYGFLIHG
jgi:IS5 family transposase